MSNLEKLIQEAQSLPYLEKQKLIEALQTEQVSNSAAAKLEAIRKARGCLTGILPSTDEFLAEKYAELNQEEK